jgi:hypothetical protein
MPYVFDLQERFNACGDGKYQKDAERSSVKNKIDFWCYNM